MTAELLSQLGHSTLLLSLALGTVLALRGLWLRCFGAKNVMLLWLSVPATLLALFLPAPVRHVQGGAASTLVLEAATPLAAMPDTLSPLVIGTDGSALLLALWLIGAVLMTILLALHQWRYHRSLGRLNALPDGSFRSQFTDKGPALVGALRPRIVVPADFDQRYSTRQQFLILAHERCHLRRGDAQLTLLASLIRCLFWFNPLVHVAWSRFRIDQELACDASVLSAHPGFRREYAEAMLSTQFAVPKLSVGCTWLSGNPLKRRITMLYTHPPGKLQLVVGTILALSASTAAALGAWSSQEPQLVYLPADTPQPELVAAAASTAAPRAVPLQPAAQRPAPSPAPAAKMQTPDHHARQAPPSADSSRTAPRSPASVPAAPPAAEAAPAPADAGNTAPEAKASRAPADDPQPTSKAAPTVDVQPARLLEARRPSFPRTFSKPELVSYSGMPEAERPEPDWQPDGRIWRMELRVALDETGEPVEASIADNDLTSGGMVRRYERLALRAVKDWRYEPARIGGTPVASEMMLAFHFDTRISRPHDIGRGPQPVKRPVFNKVPRNW